MVMRELSIFYKLKHPTILEIIGYSPVNFKHKPNPTFILELGKCTLEDLLELEKNGTSPSQWNLTKKHINIYVIALGMEYMHSLDILHRDLKPLNIKEDNYMFPKISDFGLSKCIHQHLDSLKFETNATCLGTPLYMSPELLQGSFSTKESDVYAFGMLLYQTITLGRDLKDLTYIGLVAHIIKEIGFPIHDSVPKCYKKFIEICWSKEIEKRPSFSAIVEILKTDEFLNEIEYKEEFWDYVDYVENYYKRKSQDYKFEKINSELKTKNVIHDINIPPEIKQINLEEYDKLEKLGEGGFARVYRINNKVSKNILAPKVLKDEISDLNEKDRINFTRELEIISNLQHKCILKLVGYSEKNFKGKPKPVLISEIVPNGSLSDIMKLESRGFSNNGWNDTKKLINIYGIACGMKYMHLKSYIHRDLKPENILLDEHLFPKISDLGLSKIFSNKICEINSNILGTPAYIAPEIWSESNYSMESDVYAFGLIVFEILTNERVFIELKIIQKIILEITNNQYRPKFKMPILQCYQKLIESCWSQNPNERPTFSEIVHTLKSNPEFITDTIDLDEFINYIEYINESYLTSENQTRKEKQENDKENNAKLKTYIITDAKEKINESYINTFNNVIETEMKMNYSLNLNEYEPRE